MPLVFQNPGLLDIRAVQTMGLSVKESDNPIGMFGTGLKYAIAVLLRHRNTVQIYIGKEKFHFFSQDDEFRGKKVSFVYMKQGTAAAIPLGFTTDLGKLWEPWMALRELESNARDEGGGSFNPIEFIPDSNRTSVVLSGPIENEFEKLSDIFISSKPLWESVTLSIHQGSAEQRRWIYYRGVRCALLEKPAMYIYNIKASCTLTEDRTFKHSWEPAFKLCYGLYFIDKPELLRAILGASDGFFEKGLDFANRAPVDGVPELFKSVVLSLGQRGNYSAWKEVRDQMGVEGYDEVQPQPLEIVLIEKAKHFLVRMGEANIHNYQIKIAADLGKDVLARVHLDKQEIWLTKRILEMGFKQIVSCLYEEYIHQERGYRDLTIEMQNFLFDKVIEWAAKAMGEVV